MSGKGRHSHIILSSLFVLALIAQPIALMAQSLIGVSSITGGSSVFVFRNVAKAAKRFTVSVRPTRTKAQKIETAKKIKKQYETLAKVQPRRQKAAVVDPVKSPVSKSLPPAR